MPGCETIRSASVLLYTFKATYLLEEGLLALEHCSSVLGVALTMHALRLGVEPAHELKLLRRRECILLWDHKDLVFVQRALNHCELLVAEVAQVHVVDYRAHTWRRALHDSASDEDVRSR